MIYTTPDEKNEWVWRFALLPTSVGFDANGKEVNVLLEWYQGRDSLFGITTVHRLPGVTELDWNPWYECNYDPAQKAELKQK